MKTLSAINLSMNRVSIRFAGFTEGLPPFGRVPLFAVEIECNGMVAKGLKSAGELDRMGLVVPEPEERRLVDALHTWNNAGVADDHLRPYGV